MTALDEEMGNVPDKRPVFLTVLAVLSFISIGMGSLSSLSTLTTGPMSEGQLEEYQAAQYESIELMKSQNMEGLENMIMTMMEMTIYQNNNVFYAYNSLNFILFIIGGVGVFLMLKLRKLGFHLYVIYSLVPVLAFYIFFPMEIIPSFLVIGTTLLSGVFCLLYGLNLKHMK